MQEPSVFTRGGRMGRAGGENFCMGRWRTTEGCDEFRRRSDPRKPLTKGSTSRYSNHALSSAPADRQPLATAFPSLHPSASDKDAGPERVPGSKGKPLTTSPKRSSI